MALHKKITLDFYETIAHVNKKEWSYDGEIQGLDSIKFQSIIAFKENFIIGGFPMAYPGDSTQGAPIGEIINCRCMLRFRLAGERFGFRPVTRRT
jgi:hypothetical protein